jgi:hypothetical protein
VSLSQEAPARAGVTTWPPDARHEIATANATTGAARARVAVVVVHGVGDQAPGDSAAKIADLLSNLQTPSGTPVYARFTQETIRLPVRRLEVPPHVAAGGTFAERGRALRPHAPGAAAPDAGLEFTTTLLAKYEIDGPDETYETAVLSGERIGAPNWGWIAGSGGASNGSGRPGAGSQGPSTSGPGIEIYEMYWADLSRLTQGVFRFFADTYQLLFHLGSLGVHAVTAAQVHETTVGTAGRWSRRVWVQRFAADAMAIGVPILNLILMGLAAMLVAQSRLDAVARPAAIALGGLLAAAAGGYCTYAWYQRTVRVLPFSLVALAAAAGLALDAYWHPNGSSPTLVASALATQLWLIVALAIAGVVLLYDRYRPGAAWAGAGAGGAASAWLLFQIWRPGGGSPSDAILDVGALSCLALALTWIAFFVAGWAAVAIGWRFRLEAARHVRHAAHVGPARQAAIDVADRIRRAEWTAIVTLCVPAALFVLVTTLLWWVLWRLGGSQVDAPVPHTAVLTFLSAILAKSTTGSLDTAGRIVNAVIASGAGWGFGALLGCLAVAALVGVYGLAASVLAEVFPPTRIVDGTAFGRWLDDGFRWLWLGGLLVWVGVFVVLPGGLIALMGLDHARAEWWAQANITALKYVGAALVPAAAGLMAFSNRLKSLTLGLRNVVDAALDVDNHLREHPLTAAPRARIAARYSSLLRHIYARGYDKVVIVAHSQGTVITADLLRFVEAVDRTHAHLMAGLSSRARCPVILFTMGSPLRQLYGLRFPHLYEWARHGLTGPCPPGMPIGPATRPNARALGVALWINAYRSGDYVGRHLWRSDDCAEAYRATDAVVPQPWPAAAIPAPGTSEENQPPERVEFCIGGGAHTHYWDRTAPSIALALDALIGP